MIPYVREGQAAENYELYVCYFIGVIAWKIRADFPGDGFFVFRRTP